MISLISTHGVNSPDSCLYILFIIYHTYFFFAWQNWKKETKFEKKRPKRDQKYPKVSKRDQSLLKETILATLQTASRIYLPENGIFSSRLSSGWPPVTSNKHARGE